MQILKRVPAPKSALSVGDWPLSNTMLLEAMAECLSDGIPFCPTALQGSRVWQTYMQTDWLRYGNIGHNSRHRWCFQPSKTTWTILL